MIKPETEIYLVAALDGFITKLDQVLDELDDLPDVNTSKAEHLIFGITMELAGLMDRLTEEGYEAAGSNE